MAGTERSLWLAAAAVVVGALHASHGEGSDRWGAVTGAFLGLSLLSGSGQGGRLLEGITTAGLALIVVVVGLIWMPAPVRRRALLVGGSVTGVLAVCAVAGIVGTLQARRSVDRGIDAFRAAQAAGTQGDLRAAAEHFRAAEVAFEDAAGPLSGLGAFGRAVPALAQQLEAVDEAVDAVTEAARRAGATVADVDLDAVGIRAGQVDLAAVDAVRRPAAELVDVLVGTLDRLSAIDRRLLVGPVSDALDEALDETRDAGAAVERLHRAVLEAPDLLGAARPMRFLVLFTTPVEARGRLGFPGAYAILRLEGGRLALEPGGPIDTFRPEGGFDQLAIRVPPRAQPYLAYGVSRDWRSVTIPAHAPASAELAVQMAAQAGLGAVDGVVYASPEALAAVVGLLGGVPLPSVGVTLTDATTVDFLTREQYLEFPELGQRQDRRDLLVELVAGVGMRLPQLSLPRAQDLADQLGPLVEAGHLVVSVPTHADPEAADLLADVGLDGGFPGPRDDDADSVLVTQRNTVGNKIDLFLRREVAYDVQVADDGAVSAELRITLHNEAPAAGLPGYLIGSALPAPPPPGTNLSTTLIYSRYCLVDLTLDGVAVIPPVFVERGFHVYQVQVDLGPGRVRTIRARLEGTAPGGDRPYEVVLHPGGLLAPDAATVRVADGRADRELDARAVLARPLCASLRSDGHRCS